MNVWVNNGEADGLRRYRAHYDVTVMDSCIETHIPWIPGVVKTATSAATGADKISIITIVGFRNNAARKTFIPVIITLGIIGYSYVFIQTEMYIKMSVSVLYGMFVIVTKYLWLSAPPFWQLSMQMVMKMS